MRRQGRVPETWEPGALCQAIWSGDRDLAIAAWHELGRRAARDRWARRFLFDVSEGRLSLPPDAAVSGLRALAEVNPEFALALLKCGSGPSAHVAARALGQEGRKFLQELRALMQGAEASARLSGVAGLAEAAAMGCVEAVEALAEALQDPDGAVRRAAALALGRAHGGDCAARALLCLSRLAAGRDDTSQAAAALAAAILWPVKRRGAMKLLAELSGGRAFVRKAAAMALRNLPRRAGAGVAEKYVRDPDPEVRELTVDALYRWAKQGSGLARRDLERLARDPDAAVRAAVAGLVAGDADLGALAMLQRLAADRSALVRSAAAEGLGKCRRPDALDVLQKLAKDRSVATRAAAIRSLGRYGRESEVLEACFDKEPLVRAAAARAVSPEEENVPLLLSLLDDRDVEVVRAAIQTLGRCPAVYGGPAWERLMKLAGDPALSGAVAEAAAAVFAGDPREFAEAVFWWPEGEGIPEIMWQIARAAAVPQIAELARTAARYFDEREDLGDAWHNIAVAMSALGRRDLAEGGSWLGDCARVSTVEEIAHMHVTAPAVGYESVVLFAAVSRAVGQALRAPTPALRDRHLTRALAHLDALQAMRPGRASWRRVVQVTRHWQAVLLEANAPLRAAEIRARLVSSRVVAGPRATILVKLENVGKAAARDVSVCVQGLRVGLADLESGAEADLAIPMGEMSAGPVTVRGRVKFRDRDGSREARFEGEVEALLPGKLGAVPNPYVVGKPLDEGSPMFFGRARTMSAVERALASGEHGSVVVLVGQRRIGKTSLLRQLQRHLAGEYRPVFVDIQGMLVADTREFFHVLACAATGGSLESALLSDQSFMLDGRGADMVREAAAFSEQPVVLLMDEFDDLEEKVRTGRLERDVFGQLRHLIQYTGNLRLVLSGTHRLHELAGEYWSFLFNLATHESIGCLDAETSEEVIRNPLGSLEIVCEDAAVKRVVRLAGGHPYFLQLLGFRIMERCVASGEGAVRTELVEEAAEEVVEQGEVHLHYLWDSAGPQGRSALTALAQCETGLTMEELGARSGLESADLSQAVRQLHALELVGERGGRHLLRIGLLGRWLKRLQLDAREAA